MGEIEKNVELMSKLLLARDYLMKDIQKNIELMNKLLSEDWSVHIDGSEYIDGTIGGFDVEFRCKCGARGKYSASAPTLAEAIGLAAEKISKQYP
jgi:hypothetical protein